MKWGPHLRGGPRFQLTSLGQESGNGCPGNPEKKEGTRQDTHQHTDKINKVGKVEKPEAKERRMFTQGDRLGRRKRQGGGGEGPCWRRLA